MVKKGSKKAGSGAIDDQDAKLLEQAFADVAPLPGRKVRSGEKPKRPKPRKAVALPPARDPEPRPAKLPELSTGDTPGVDKKTQQRMRRGQIEIEGRLDLHGMYQDEAFEALEKFLARSQAAGRKCVLVITGKGTRPDGPDGERIGVLRQAVPGWLNRAGLRERIQSFREAAPNHGGSGALYILLRRAR